MAWRPRFSLARLLLGPVLAMLAACSTTPSFRAEVQPEVLRSLQRYATEYVLLPGDQIDVSIYGVPDLSKAVIVRPDGYVSLPALKDVSVGGLTVPRATEKLTALYSARLVNPDVTVSVANPREASVFVLGDVARPGPVPFRSATTAAQALAQSGGVLRTGALSGVAVVRLDKDGYLTAEVIRREQPGVTGFYAALNQVVLQPNDMLIVPENGRSQFNRFVQDFITTPMGAANQVISPYFQFRLINDVVK